MRSPAQFNCKKSNPFSVIEYFTLLQKHTLWFLHLLLFTFSYCLCLPRHIRAGPIGPDPEMQILARSCELWMNGIYWENYDDKVELIVEVTEHHRCITVVTSMNDIEKSRKIFNDVVQTILTLKSQMHIFKREEYLIGPSDVGEARSLLMDKRILYNIKYVARSVLTKVMLEITKTLRLWVLKRLWEFTTLFYALFLQSQKHFSVLNSRFKGITFST